MTRTRDESKGRRPYQRREKYIMVQDSDGNYRNYIDYTRLKHETLMKLRRKAGIKSRRGGPRKSIDDLIRGLSKGLVIVPGPVRNEKGILKTPDGCITVAKVMREHRSRINSSKFSIKNISIKAIAKLKADCEFINDVSGCGFAESVSSKARSPSYYDKEMNRFFNSFPYALLEHYTHPSLGGISLALRRYLTTPEGQQHLSDPLYSDSAVCQRYLVFFPDAKKTASDWGDDYPPAEWKGDTLVSNIPYLLRKKMMEKPPPWKRPKVPVYHVIRDRMKTDVSGYQSEKPASSKAMDFNY